MAGTNCCRTPIKAAALLSACVLVIACGYRPARGALAGEGWCVTSGPEPATHPQAVSALVHGARDALARSHSLVSCDRGDRFVVQVLDVQFEAVGVVGGERGPASRSTRVEISAAGQVLAERGRTDLGTATEAYVVANGSTPLAEEHAREVGVVMAARRAGETLAQRLLEGSPAAEP